jgi:hypothetical protein
MNRITVTIAVILWLAICALIIATAPSVQVIGSCYAPKNQLHPQIKWDSKTWGRGLA